MRRLIRVLFVGLMMAALSFSYAIATASRTASPAPDSAAPRALTDPITFIEPFLLAGTNPLGTDPAFPNGGENEDPNGYDLGDAATGRDTVRYLSAKGLFLPYVFRVRPLLDAFGSSGTVDLLPEFSQAGKLKQTFTTVGTGAARFNVTVANPYIGDSTTGTFRLNIVPSNQFRFGHDRLPSAQRGRNYFTYIPTLGGVAPVKLAVTNIIYNNVPVGSLEAFGCALTPDGVFYGRPPVVGNLQFTVVATDSFGALATSRRDASVQSQTFTIAVADDAVAASDLLPMKSSLSGSQVNTQDTFTLSGLLDSKGETVETLAGSEFTFRLGAASFTGTFDDKGKISKALTNDGTGAKFTVAFSPSTGRFSLKLSKANLSLFVRRSAYTKGAEVIIPMSLEFERFRIAQVIRTQAKVGGLKFNLGYSPFKRGGGLVNGAFQIVNLIGKDGGLKDEAAEGSRWFVRFMAAPRFGLDPGTAGDIFPVRKGENTSLSGTIRIGEAFSQSITADIVSNRARFKAATLKDDGIIEATFDGEKYLHSFTTNILTTVDTGIAPAIKSKDPTLFRLGLDIDTYKGETGRVIVPNRTTWTPR